jgi:hypothetical protein
VKKEKGRAVVLAKVAGMATGVVWWMAIGVAVATGVTVAIGVSVVAAVLPILLQAAGEIPMPPRWKQAHP